jgi:membrane associated rhomboid family serine protease
MSPEEKDAQDGPANHDPQPEVSEASEISDTEEHRGAPERLPLPLYTLILVTCIVAVTAVQFSVDTNLGAVAVGLLKPAVIEYGEYWRILTGATVHGGLAHIAFNSFAFFSFGRLFEFLSNRAHLAIVFLVAVIGGGLASLILFPEGFSVGASGGILGLVAYLGVYSFKRRRFVTPEFRKNLLFNIGFILVFGLVLYQYIDNYAHIGGLLTGAVYALIQVPSDPNRDPREAGALARTAGLAALVFFILVSIFSIVTILSFELPVA